MKLWMLGLLALVPSVPQADEALKKETLFNSLHRFALPRLEYGAKCDVTERDGTVTCFLSWRVNLDESRGAGLKKAIDQTIKDGKLDATSAGASLWQPAIQQEIETEYARLQKSLGVKCGELKFGGCIEFRWNKDDYCLMSKGSTKEWAFVSH